MRWARDDGMNMQHLTRSIIVLYFALFWICGPTVRAENQLVITYDAFERKLTDNFYHTETLTKETIENLKSSNLQQLLSKISSLSISNEGGEGQTSSIRIRGSDAGEVLVLVDGVRINDPTDINNEPLLGFSNLLEIVSVEVIKGNQSAIWGQDAIGGVVNIITTDPDNEKKRNVGITLGSNGSEILKAGLSLGKSTTKVRLNAGVIRKSGKSVQEPRLDLYDGNKKDIQVGLEKDPYREKSAKLSIVHSIGNSMSINTTIMKNEALANYDGFQETQQYQNNKYSSNIHSVTAEITSGSQKLISKLQEFKTKRSQFGGYEGSESNIFITRINSGANYKSRFGFEKRTANLNKSAGLVPKIKKNRSYSIFTNGSLSFDSILLNGAIRIDNYDRFESATSYRLGQTFKNLDPLFVDLTLGNGFKPPSLYQMDNWKSMSNIKPEYSMSSELSFSLKPYRISIFNLKTKNHIEYSWPDGYSNSTRKSEINGFEVNFKNYLKKNLKVMSSYIYLDTKQGKVRQPRRARNELKNLIEYKLSDNLSGNFFSHFVGDRIGVGPSAPGTGDYWIFDTSITKNLGRNLKLSFKVDNILDSTYQEVVNSSNTGYSTPGRSAFLIFEWFSIN